MVHSTTDNIFGYRNTAGGHAMKAGRLTRMSAHAALDPIGEQFNIFKNDLSKNYLKNLEWLNIIWHSNGDNIYWLNDDLLYRCVYVSTGRNELTGLPYMHNALYFTLTINYTWNRL